jgi:hypothetical protein
MFTVTVTDVMKLLSSRMPASDELIVAFIQCWSGIIRWQSVITGDETVKLTREFAPATYTRDRLVLQISREIGLDPDDTEDLFQCFVDILREYLDQSTKIILQPVGTIVTDSQREYEIQIIR